MSSLNQQQFFDTAPYTLSLDKEAATKSRQRYLNPSGAAAKVRAVEEAYAWGDMGDRELPPVGLRGSIQDRIKLGDRMEKSEKLHDRWRSMAQRSADTGDPPSGETHPRTGLPRQGDLNTTTHIGLTKGAFAPNQASYWGSTKSAWAKYGRSTYVPTPLLETPQDEVSSQRLHEVVLNPNTRDSRSMRGLRPELPRVYHQPGVKDRYMVVDGNHRLSADLLQGKLFSEVNMVSAKDIPEMTQHNQRIQDHRERAEERWDTRLPPPGSRTYRSHTEGRQERLWDGDV